MLKSARGIPLVCQDKVIVPTITVENYLKWYDLYVVRPDGSVKPLSEEIAYQRAYDRWPDTAWGDHMPNPDFVTFVANRLGFDLHSESFEMIVGRWVIEREGKYL